MDEPVEDCINVGTNYNSPIRSPPPGHPASGLDAESDMSNLDQVINDYRSKIQSACMRLENSTKVVRPVSPLGAIWIVEHDFFGITGRRLDICAYLYRHHANEMALDLFLSIYLRQALLSNQELKEMSAEEFKKIRGPGLAWMIDSDSDGGLSLLWYEEGNYRRIYVYCLNVKTTYISRTAMLPETPDGINLAVGTL